MMCRLLFDTSYTKGDIFPVNEIARALTAKAQVKQNISKTFEIIFCQKPADKEKIVVTISIQCLKGKYMAVNIMLAKGIGSTQGSSVQHFILGVLWR